MRLSRKRLLQAGAACAGAALPAGCSEAVRRLVPPSLPPDFSAAVLDPADRRALNRITWGISPALAAHVHGVGLDAYIEEQLSPQRLPEEPACSLRLGLLDTLEMNADDARDWETSDYPEVGQGQAARELQQAAVIRAVYSSRQLHEVMADFWANHFNVSQLKADCSWLKTVDDRLMRRHTLGRFEDLVRTSARSPAMLFYLDNRQNQRRGPAAGAGPNENYARELFELHTLGVHGGYTQRDIEEAARCFTGWNYAWGFTWQPGRFEFAAGRHDDGAKRVLGVNIPPGGGESDGDRVIDIACAHPSTARHLAAKLVERFLGPGTHQELQGRVERAFTRTRGDIRQTLSVLLHSPQLRLAPARKLKRPLEYAASSLRAVAASTTGEQILPYLERMGQTPYHWPMPDGYPEEARAWAPGLLQRWNFALDLLNGAIEATEVPLDDLRATAGKGDELQGLARAITGASASAELCLRFRRQAGGLDDSKRRQIWLALQLASPRFQWR